MSGLYMVSLGGEVSNANIEVHDVQFAVGDSIEAVIPLVRNNWYGRDFKLHLDSYMKVKGADGYSLELSRKPVNQSEQLFFVCLGGYTEDNTQEWHQVKLLVCTTEEEAKAKAMEVLPEGYIQVHVDSVVQVGKRLLTDEGERWWLKLEPTEEQFDMTPDWFGYRRLDRE